MISALLTRLKFETYLFTNRILTAVDVYRPFHETWKWCFLVLLFESITQCNIQSSEICIVTSRILSLSYLHDVPPLYIFCKYFHGKCVHVFSSLAPQLNDCSTIFTTRSDCFTVEVARFNRLIYSIIFISRASCPWNTLPVSCFPTTYKSPKI